MRPTASQPRRDWVHPRSGCVSLIDGTPFMGPGAWRAPLHQLIAAMMRAGHMTVYGLVKRGSKLSAARFGTSLEHDWPPTAEEAAARSLGFEDAYAPDSFGVQLLGPDYGVRVPRRPNWRETRLGAGRVLLEHVDLGAWFDALFAPFGGSWRLPQDAVPVPDVLARARLELAPIIFTDEIAVEPGHDDQVHRLPRTCG
jgi:hypothetical protein